MNKRFTAFAVPILALGLSLSGPYTAWAKDLKSTSAEFRATKIVGMKVKDHQGEKLGKIKELLVDPQESARIAFAVLDPAGSLEFGRDRLVAIPFPALSRSDKGQSYVLNMPRDKLAKAPSFDEDHWPNVADRSWSGGVYRYYGLTPYWIGEK
jgi:sporulation protein YlmC with PRC-barrel domain